MNIILVGSNSFSFILSIIQLKVPKAFVLPYKTNAFMQC